MTDISSSANVLMRLLQYARGYRRRISLATLCSVLNKLFDVMPEILIGMAIDVVVRQERSFLADFGILEPFNQMLFLGVLTIAVWAFESLFQFFLHIRFYQRFNLFCLSFVLGVFAGFGVIAISITASPK